MVVDDDEDIRSIYAESLALNGYEVLHASDGKEALAIALKAAPAAVVMDLSMPVMDGLEATRALKDHLRTGGVRVIVVTGNSAPAQQERAQAAGCDAVLTKPCPPEIVIMVIEHLLRGEPLPHHIIANPGTRILGYF